MKTEGSEKALEVLIASDLRTVGGRPAILADDDREYAVDLMYGSSFLNST